VRLRLCHDDQIATRLARASQNDIAPVAQLDPILVSDISAVEIAAGARERAFAEVIDEPVDDLFALEPCISAHPPSLRFRLDIE
jgi:hypothetical protein